ncbi:ferrous iron transport protein A [bacterium]|nr:ferrous iron transport protein A [bacterium]
MDTGTTFNTRPFVAAADANVGRAATLAELAPGARARVLSLQVHGPQRRRLMDLGLIAGAEVYREFSSPFGDPVAFRVFDSLVALRREQAEAIRVQLIDSETQPEKGAS